MSVSRTIGIALAMGVFAWALAAQPFGSRIVGSGQARSGDGLTASVKMDLFTTQEASALYGEVSFRSSTGVEISAAPTSAGGFMTTSGRVATFDGPAVMRFKGVVRRGELHLLINDPCARSADADSLALRFCPDDECPPFSFEGAMVGSRFGVMRQGKTIP